MKYRDENSNLRSHIKTLRGFAGALFVVACIMGYGWIDAKSAVSIHIPPDTRSGAVVTAGEVPEPNVYSFAFQMFQLLNHWAKDGASDYGEQIFSMAAYLTPRFRETLKNDMNSRSKRGELRGRAREMHPIPGQGYEEDRVDILNDDTWVVWLDFRIAETIQGMPVKDVMVRYPMRVVRYAVNREVNPWGMALDGFAGDGPKRLTEADLAASNQ